VGRISEVNEWTQWDLILIVANHGGDTRVRGSHVIQTAASASASLRPDVPQSGPCWPRTLHSGRSCLPLTRRFRLPVPVHIIPDLYHHRNAQLNPSVIRYSVILFPPGTYSAWAWVLEGNHTSHLRTSEPKTEEEWPLGIMACGVNLHRSQS